ncbi:hypothetical protein FACS189479_02220 [Spirochaetia bacterium]|nr:hypothetical protein FACS189479_02220 [Spirochaetia bacterium]
MEKTLNKENGEDRLPRGYIPAWATRSISLAVNTMLLMQVTYYATEVVGLGAAVVGTLLLAARLFDGVTDFGVGFIIDRTKTRFGKARPYELAIIPLWLCTILLYSTPNIGNTGKMIYFFVFYSLISAVCATILYGSEAVYLGRSLSGNVRRAKVLALSGLFVMIISAVCSMFLPRLMALWGDEPGGWTRISLVYGIPLGIIGLVRFIFIKETNVDEAAESRGGKMRLGEIFRALVKNKYIFIFSTVVLITNIINSMTSGVTAYFFTYIIGDLSLMGVIAMLGLFTPFVLLLFPLAMKKIGGTNFVRIGFFMALIGNVLKFIGGTNLPLIITGSLLAGVGANFVLMMSGLFYLDCMDYGEWKTGKRLEGVLNSVGSFASKLGGGVAAAAVGFFMSAAGYDGAAAIQPAAALSSITALFSIIPAVLCAILLIMMRFYDLDKKLPQIREELAAGKNAVSQ